MMRCFHSEASAAAAPIGLVAHINVATSSANSAIIVDCMADLCGGL